MKVVTAAAGRRDAYQLPIALAEAKLLQAHVTDLYLPDFLAPLLEKFTQKYDSNLLSRVSSRHQAALSSHLVHCSKRRFSAQILQLFLPSLKQRWSHDQDPISWSAFRLADKHDSALLLHMGYAHYAFKASLGTARPLGLVQYHPHIAECSRILLEDLSKYPDLTDAKAAVESDVLDPTNQFEIDNADMIICNSSFTANTCILAGAESSSIRVIPFGIDLPATTSSPIRSKLKSCNFLFVGSGLHRKGLHHLLEAWDMACLDHSMLTLVCRHIDPQIKLKYSHVNNVVLLDSVSNHDLQTLYDHSDVFVMPSLVEGFGYVYLEAMSRGCFCVGTPNTGLPDIADPDCAKIVSIGQPAKLAVVMQELEAHAHTFFFDRELIKAKASDYSWRRYRNSVVESVQAFLPTSPK